MAGLSGSLLIWFHLCGEGPPCIAGMIDQFPKLFDTTFMLTTTKHAARPGKTASPCKPDRNLAKDLEFVSANQQLEGLPGKITEAVAAHEPNMDEIIESAKRFGAQIPTEANHKRPAIFQSRRADGHSI